MAFRRVINMENRVHLWIDSSFLLKKSMHYFELDYSEEDGIDSPNYRVCGFCKDLGIVVRRRFYWCYLSF